MGRKRHAVPIHEIEERKDRRMRFFTLLFGLLFLFFCISCLAAAFTCSPLTPGYESCSGSGIIQRMFELWGILLGV